MIKLDEAISTYLVDQSDFSHETIESASLAFLDAYGCILDAAAEENASKQLEAARQELMSQMQAQASKIENTVITQKEFNVIWGRIYKSYFKDDLTYSVVYEEEDDLIEASY